MDIEHFSKARGSLLEIGTVRGDFLSQIKKRGCDVHGIEISNDAVNIAKNRHGLIIHEGTIESFETNLKFDVICSYQTLEHVPDPYFLIKRSYDLHRHLNHFTPRFLKSYFQKLGFEIIYNDKYQAKFILNLIKFREKIRSTSNHGHKVNVNSSIKTNLSKLFKKEASFKQRLLRLSSSALQGWRFTIIGQKRHS